MQFLNFLLLFKQLRLVHLFKFRQSPFPVKNFCLQYDAVFVVLVVAEVSEVFELPFGFLVGLPVLLSPAFLRVYLFLELDYLLLEAV
jgi:hypothetical protein